MTHNTILITGAEGFIGSHLTEALAREGRRVRAMVLYNSFGRYGWLDTLPATCATRSACARRCAGWMR
jgi:NDP-hexose 4,6-dehydratase